jgi:hypothetical protein
MRIVRFEKEACEKCKEAVTPKKHGSRIVKVCEKCKHVSVRHRSFYGEECCEKMDVRYVYFEVKNGTVHKKQCFGCGLDIGLVTKIEASAHPTFPFNRELYEAFRQRENKYNEQLKKVVQEYSFKRKVQQKETWFEEEYNAYLSSETWQAKRLKVLHRDGYICQACCTRKAVQVHHKSYRFFGEEPLYHLISVCIECHQKIDRLKALKLKGEYYLENYSDFRII